MVVVLVGGVHGVRKPLGHKSTQITIGQEDIHSKAPRITFAEFKSVEGSCN